MAYLNACFHSGVIYARRLSTTCGVCRAASKFWKPAIPTRCIHSRSRLMPSWVMFPFIQCHHTRGRAELGGVSKPRFNVSGVTLCWSLWSMFLKSTSALAFAKHSPFTLQLRRICFALQNTYFNNRSLELRATASAVAGARHVVQGFCLSTEVARLRLKAE